MLSATQVSRALVPRVMTVSPNRPGQLEIVAKIMDQFPPNTPVKVTIYNESFGNVDEEKETITGTVLKYGETHNHRFVMLVKPDDGGKNQIIKIDPKYYVMAGRQNDSFKLEGDRKLLQLERNYSAIRHSFGYEHCTAVSWELASNQIYRIEHI